MSGTARDRLESLLGFDPAKADATSQDVVQQAVAEIQEERSKAAAAKAKEFITKGMELVQRFDAAQKAARKEEQKFEKDLKKLMDQIDRLKSGKSVADEEEESSS